MSSFPLPGCEESADYLTLIISNPSGVNAGKDIHNVLNVVQNECSFTDYGEDLKMFRSQNGFQN